MPFRVVPHSDGSLTMTREVSIVPRACLIAADVIVILATWRAAFRTRTTVRKAFASIGGQSALLNTLLRDGEWMFPAVVRLLNSLSPTGTMYFVYALRLSYFCRIS